MKCCSFHVRFIFLAAGSRMSFGVSFTRLVFLFALVNLVGCASVTMVNPVVMDTGDVRASAEVEAAATGAATKLAAQVGVGVYKGLELDAGAGIVPSVQERPYADEDRLKGTFFTGGASYGLESDRAGIGTHIKLGFDAHREEASYEATAVGVGSWLVPYVYENWIDRVTWRYRLHGTFGAEVESGVVFYTGGALVLSTHDIVKHDEVYDYDPETGDRVGVSGYSSETAFELYPSIEGMGGVYAPLGQSRFALQIEGSLAVPFALFVEDPPVEDRLYSPFRDLAQVNIGIVWTLDPMRKEKPPGDAGGFGSGGVIP